ncbi:hypothetical protein CMO93_05670 [Candidatus Woesearchaeota archaeon]|nr:hypothetical protein [Candidatus Woesearchaeota archaeon]|tara:strand:- start:954 stop:1229 length:276 start_codon:yes stop_codon:yes gene_type:complete
MPQRKVGTFEIILLIVGIGVAILGFQLINQVYSIEKEISWLMVIAIFNWLMLLVLFILLSLTVDASKKQLEETKKIGDMLKQEKIKKRKLI